MLDNDGVNIMDFEKAQGEFKKYLEANKTTETERRQYTPETVRIYGEYLIFFGRYLAKIHPEIYNDISQLRPRHLLAYNTYLTIEYRKKSGSPLSKSTVNLRMASVKAFGRFVHLMDMVPIDPTRGVPKIKPQQNDKHVIEGYITRAEFNNRINSYIEHGSLGRRCFEALRNLTLCRLLFATGMRISAAVGITRSDLDFNQLRVKVREKGWKQCIKYFDPRHQNKYWS